MKVIIQCVKKASVTVNNVLISKINRGYLLLVGIEKDDSEDDINSILDKGTMQVYNYKKINDNYKLTRVGVK